MSMGFQDIIRKDISSVFLQAEEFAEVLNVNGKNMLALLDDSELQERETYKSDPADGIYENALTMYVPAAEYGQQPKVGNIMRIGSDRVFTVRECIEENGLYKITMTRTECW